MPMVLWNANISPVRDLCCPASLDLRAFLCTTGLCCCSAPFPDLPCPHGVTTTMWCLSNTKSGWRLVWNNGVPDRIMLCPLWAELIPFGFQSAWIKHSRRVLVASWASWISCLDLWVGLAKTACARPGAAKWCAQSLGVGTDVSGCLEQITKARIILIVWEMCSQLLMLLIIGKASHLVTE